jgi:uncharacterized membrane protein YebE (DUF533 family)
MWRCVIAIAHADGSVQTQERDYLQNVISNLNRAYHLTPEQKKTLEDDLKNPRKISALLPHVTDPQDRASVIYFGDALAWADGELSVDEETILKKLHDDQMAKVDMNRLRAEIAADLKARKAERENEIKKEHAEGQKASPTFAALDRLLLRFGIDILD